jgi:hypothetical protein
MEAAMANTALSEKAQLARLDFPGFAQEFLRRNPDYRRAHESVMTGVASVDPIAREVMAERWGLCFPMSAAAIRQRSAGAVVGEDMRLHQYP